MSYEECWHNSLNRYLAIMDTRTDDIPKIANEIIKPIDIPMEGEVEMEEIWIILTMKK